LSSIEQNSNQQTPPIFSASDLSWVVSGHSILDGLSFSIGAGEFVGIIGPNGAGKSSLLRCLYGKNKLSSGSLSFQSKSVQVYTRREIAQKIAVVVQEPPTNFDMSVSDVVAMGLIPHRPLLSFSSQQDLALIEQAINEVELTDKQDADFNTLSGGEKQRVMIARAIVQRPEVLILDEPTNHLDVQHQIEVLQLAKNMGITVLLSIHDLNIASAFCDRLILMDKGKILANGDCTEVLTTDHLNSVFKINAVIDPHPFHNGQRITYDFFGGGNHA
jgi:iron complex transport system ATP-binding protein